MYLKSWLWLTILGCTSGTPVEWRMDAPYRNCGHTAQIRWSPVTPILDIWWATDGPPSAGPAFLTLFYDNERIVPPVQGCWPIGGLGWRHKAPRIIESVSFREYPPAGPAQFNLCHLLAWQGPLEVLGSVSIKHNPSCGWITNTGL